MFARYSTFSLPSNILLHNLSINSCVSAQVLPKVDRFYLRTKPAEVLSLNIAAERMLSSSYSCFFRRLMNGLGVTQCYSNICIVLSTFDLYLVSSSVLVIVLKPRSYGFTGHLLCTRLERSARRAPNFSST